MNALQGATGDEKKVVVEAVSLARGTSSPRQGTGSKWRTQGQAVPREGAEQVRTGLSLPRPPAPASGAR